MSDNYEEEFDEPMTIAAPAPVPAAVDPDLNPKSNETPEQKRLKLMALGNAYRESQPKQTAANTWALVEVRDAVNAQTAAIDRQTAAIDRQTQVLEWQAEIAQAQANEARLQTQLRYYEMKFQEAKLHRASRRCSPRASRTS